MTRLSLLFIIFVFFSACGDGVPKGIITKENIAAVLTDLHLADGYTSSLYGDSTNLKVARVYKALYKKHNTDSVGLRKSLVYYSERPEELEIIYKQVETNLSDIEKADRKRTEDLEKEALRISLAEEAIRMDKIKFTSDSLKMLEGTYDFGLQSYRSPIEDYLILEDLPDVKKLLKIKPAVKDSLKIKTDTLKTNIDTLKSKSLRRSLLLKKKKREE